VALFFQFESFQLCWQNLVAQEELALSYQFEQACYDLWPQGLI